jgi:hypothetical protein
MPRRVGKAPRATQATEQPQLDRANPPAVVTVAPLGPVDTPARPPHPAFVSKPRKVEEPQAPYSAKKPAKAAASKTAASGVRYMNDAAFKKASDKVFKTHPELFRKLAQ